MAEVDQNPTELLAEMDQNPTELEQPHENEYQSEDEPKNEHEYQPDNEHENEHAYQPANEHENENAVVLDLAHEHEEDKHETVDGMPENLHPGVQDLVKETVHGNLDGGGERWPGWPGESVFRILVPAQKVGSIIGRKGEYIKKACEETKARIKILDGPPGTRERAVMVSAKEEPNAPLPPAVDGLLRVHKRVVDGLENDSSNPPSGLGGKVSTKLLVPASQAGSLIGKQGTTVKSIQEESSCVVRVLGTEELPVFALQDDRIVEIVGEAVGVHKAIELIASHLRKFLVDRSIIQVIEMQMKMPNSHAEHMPPPQPWGPPPQSFPPNAPAGPGYGASPHFMPPPRQFDNYYPPVDMAPPSEKQSHHGISAYGRESANRSSSSQPAQSVITQITHQMQIPLSYADAVIGTQGANISYIRRVSGATVTIQEARGVPGEMTVEISGTASQAQTAQQLIQNFMAEAAAGQQQTQHAPPSDYNSYAAHGSAYPAHGSGYASQPSNPSLAGQSGGYGSVYGSNYGY